MSDYAKIHGVSYKLHTIKTNEDAIEYFKGFFGTEFNSLTNLDEWYYDLFYDNGMYKWQPHIDIEGNYGWVYFMEDNYPTDYEPVFYLQYSKLKEVGLTLSNILTESELGLDAVLNGLQIFSIQYYNGSDNPFKF